MRKGGGTDVKTGKCFCTVVPWGGHGMGLNGCITLLKRREEGSSLLADEERFIIFIAAQSPPVDTGAEPLLFWHHGRAAVAMQP